MPHSLIMGRWGPVALAAALALGGCVEDLDPPVEATTGVAPQDPTTDADAPSTDGPDTPTSDPGPALTSDGPEPPPTTDAPDTDATSTSTGDATDGDTTDGETTEDASTTEAVDPSTSSATDGTSSTGDETTGDATTDPADPSGDPPHGSLAKGKTVTETVSGGLEAKSPNYRMVFTLGQPAQLQGTHQSENFRVQGGLIGANGEPL